MLRATGLFGFVCCVLTFQTKVRNRNPPAAEIMASLFVRSFFHSITLPFPMFQDGRLLEEGLKVLPFFRKGKKYLDYPVNPVSQKGRLVN